jgi:hypothetical protein
LASADLSTVTGVMTPEIAVKGPIGGPARGALDSKDLSLLGLIDD